MSTFISIVFLFLVTLTNPGSFDISTFPHSSISTQDIRVIDGDTFIIKEDERVRVACIDSPDVKTTEGVEATKLTQTYINNSKEITLYRLGDDFYGRTVGVIRDKDRVDLGQYLMHHKGAIYNPYRRGKICRYIYPILP